LPSKSGMRSNYSEMKAELRASDSLLSAILSTVPDSLIVINDQGIILRFSSAASELFGYSEADMLGRNVSFLMPEPNAAAHDGYISHYLQTDEKRIIGTGRIVQGKRNDGSVFPMELYIGEAEADGHRVFTGFIKDLSERFSNEAAMQKLQTELAHASRLSAAGSLAAALAHELNQPLTAVANYMSAARDLLRDLNPETQPYLLEALDEASKSSVMAGQIVRRMREFVTKGEGEREILPLGKLIGDATTLGLIGAGAKGVSWSIDIDHAGDVFVDRIQIQQVLINLMRNAIEAMAKSDPKMLKIIARNRSDTIAEVSVSDTGSGLAPEVVKQLFQPFITTKADGMGLGLSICRTIIESHGGQLTATDNPGGGTVFRFTLNRAWQEIANG
jgi:two-component system, LuxR family, sensor kinase FixL